MKNFQIRVKSSQIRTWTVQAKDAAEATRLAIQNAKDYHKFDITCGDKVSITSTPKEIYSRLDGDMIQPCTQEK